MSLKTKLIFAIFLAIAAFFLITEHRAHLYGIVPYLLFIIMIPLHLLMHSSHGDHGSSRKTKRGGHH